MELEATPRKPPSRIAGPWRPGSPGAREAKGGGLRVPGSLKQTWTVHLMNAAPGLLEIDSLQIVGPSSSFLFTGFVTDIHATMQGPGSSAARQVGHKRHKEFWNAIGGD